MSYQLHPPKILFSGGGRCLRMLLQTFAPKIPAWVDGGLSELVLMRADTRMENNRHKLNFLMFYNGIIRIDSVLIYLLALLFSSLEFMF